MNLRRRANIDNYLYEIIEDYKCSVSKEEKDIIFSSFCTNLWNCNNKRRVYTKSIKFNVSSNLLDTDIGKIFDTCTRIDYTGYRSTTQKRQWDFLIRQKINNIYTKYFDKKVILNKEYMDLLKVPKKLYYRWVFGEDFNQDYLTNLIDNNFAEIDNVKNKCQKYKIDMSWEDYKILTEKHLYKIINNCILLNDYENKNFISNFSSFFNEDNFYIKYICKSLDGEIRKWQKKYYNLPQSTRKEYKRCIVCGSLYIKESNRNKYCKKCGIKINREKTKERMRTKRKHISID